MASSNELEIVITGDAASATAAFDQVSEKSKSSAADIEKFSVVSAAAFAVIAGAIGLAVREFDQAQQAQFNLQASLAATKGVVGLTADELTRLASALQSQTTFSDEAVLGAENILLTFTKIGRETFPQATAAVLDLAAKFNVDLKAASLAVGKALDNPAEALGSLGRLGVKFTQQQQDLVDSLVQTGKAAQAQAFILEQLAVASGGAAAAQTQTLGGSLQQLKNDFSDILEIIGGQFQPTLIIITQQTRLFLQALKENTPVLEFTTSLLKSVGVTLALATGITGSIAAFNRLAAFLPLLNAELTLTTISVRALVGATGFGLIILAIGFVILKFDFLKNFTTGTFFAIFTIVQESANQIAIILEHLGNVINATFAGDLSFALSESKALFNSFIGSFSEIGRKTTEAFAQGQAIGNTALQAENLKQQQQAKAQADALNAIAVQGATTNVGVSQKERDEIEGIELGKRSLLTDNELGLSADLLAIDASLGDGQVNEFGQTSEELISAAQARRAALTDIESSGGGGAPSGQPGTPTGGGGSLGGSAGLGILASDSEGGRQARAALRANPSQFINYTPGVNPSDLLKAVVQAVQAGGFRFQKGFSGEGFNASFSGREIVIPETFAEGIRKGRFVLSGAGQSTGGVGGRSGVDLRIGFDGREASRFLTARQNADKALGTARVI